MFNIKSTDMKEGECTAHACRAEKENCHTGKKTKIILTYAVDQDTTCSRSQSSPAAEASHDWSDGPCTVQRCAAKQLALISFKNN